MGPSPHWKVVEDILPLPKETVQVRFGSPDCSVVHLVGELKWC